MNLPDREGLLQLELTPRSEIDNMVQAVFINVLGHERFSDDDDFLMVGGDSLGLFELASELSILTGRPLSLHEVYAHQSIARRASRRLQVTLTMSPIEFEPIAVIGIAGRFLGAPNVPDFRESLEAGRRLIEDFSWNELSAAGLEIGELGLPRYVGSYGWLSILGLELKVHSLQGEHHQLLQMPFMTKVSRVVEGFLRTINLN